MSTNPATALEVLVRAVYRHFQGGLIQVVKIVEHSETSEKLVLYSEINDPSTWRVVSLSEFVGDIEDDGRQKKRFSLTDISIGTIGGMLVGRQ